MRKTRVIPVLLLKGMGFYKTKRFKDPVYLGDPINILKIFNGKEVDEIMIFDIMANTHGDELDWTLLTNMATECFMPLGYGGGLRNLDQIKKVLGLGFEKICLNTFALKNPQLIEQAAKEVGSQSVVVCLDVKKTLFSGEQVMGLSGKQKTSWDYVEWAKEVEDRGAGEIIINSIDRDGTMEGYDEELIKKVSNEVSIPVVAVGGAASVQDFSRAVSDCHAAAVAAGSMFVFHGPHRAVLISYPRESELRNVLP